MHIPDGFLSKQIALSLNGVSLAAILYGARRIRVEAATRIMPVMGVLAAFVLAAQMLNFPVLGGTSGHLVGGALLAILLGPMAGFLTMATVILAQALFLQDGGLVALGANIFNIGALTVFTGYATFRLLGGAGAAQGRLAFAAFAAGWASMMVSAVACALQLALSGVIPLRVGLTAMAGYHAVIGVAEGGLTAAVLAFLARVRPDLLDLRRSVRMALPDWAGALVLVAIPFAILVLAGSSALPDPMQKLLGEEPPPAGAAAEGQGLLAGGRLHDFLWQGAVLLGLIVAAWFAAWALGKRKDHA